MTDSQVVATLLARWQHDAVQFVRDVFAIEPDAWQQDALRAFSDPTKQRISLQACVGPGKTAVLAWCGWHFLVCQGELEEHPKGLAVAITGANLAANLWPELAKWQSRSEYLKRAFTWTKTRVSSNDHPETWFLEARSWPKTANPAEQGATLSGHHAKYVLTLIDESGGIPEAVAQAAEQSLSNCEWGKIVQAGNPMSLEGMLYAAWTRWAHLWTVIRITADPQDPKRTPRIPIDYAQSQIDTYGRDNPWVMSQILGQFPPSSINALLSVDEVDAAMKRQLDASVYVWAQSRIGGDVARYGDDRTVLFPRQGRKAYQPVVMRHARDSAVSTDIATAILKLSEERDTDVVILDATGGWAAGVSDVLQATRRPAVNVQFHAKAYDERYKNRRAELWFQMAEWVKSGGWLPNIPELIGELTTPTYTYVNGKFQLEPKEQVKERLGRSPDLADALALTFGVPEVVPKRMKGAAVTYSDSYDWA